MILQSVEYGIVKHLPLKFHNCILSRMTIYHYIYMYIMSQQDVTP